MYRLHTFGGLRIDGGDTPIDGAAAQRSRQALLAAIASAGDSGISRDRLLIIFWPESDTERARGALKQAIYTLRRDIKEPELILGVEDLRLNPQFITADVIEFEQALRGGKLAHAVSLYRGPFLDGVHVGNGGFGEWRDDESQRLAGMYRRALEQLASDAAIRDAVHWWRALVALDHHNASYTVSTMRAMVAFGDATGALAQAEHHARRMRVDLELEPDAMVMALASEIRRAPVITASAESVRVMVTDVPMHTVPRENATAADATSANGVSHSSPSTPVSAPLLPSQRASRRWRLLVASVAVLSATAMSALPFRTDVDGVRLITDATNTEADVVPLMQTQLLQRIPSLRGDRRWGTRAQYTVEASIRPVGDSLELRAQLQHRAPSWRHVVNAIRVPTRERAMGVRRLTDEIAIQIAIDRDPLFQRWGTLAGLPRRWESYQAVRSALTVWSPPQDGGLQIRLDSAAALDSLAGTPLVLKALAFEKRGMSQRAESVLRELAQSSRRLGPWDEAVLAVVRAWIARDWSHAHEASHRLLALVPHSEWSLLAVHSVLGVGRPREAGLLLRDVPTNVAWTRKWMDLTTSQSYVLSGAYESALEHARARIKYSPEHAFFEQLMIKALSGLGRAAEVESICERALAERLTPQPCQQGVKELRAHGYVTAARRVVARYLVALRTADTTSDSTYAAERSYLAEATGDYDELFRSLAKVSDAGMNEEQLWWWTKANAARGDRAAVSRGLTKLERARSSDYLQQAEVAALLGDKDRAVALVSAALRSGHYRGFPLRFWAGLDRLNGYPPYELLARQPDEREHLAAVGMR